MSNVQQGDHGSTPAELRDEFPEAGYPQFDFHSVTRFCEEAHIPTGNQVVRYFQDCVRNPVHNITNLDDVLGQADLKDVYSKQQPKYLVRKQRMVALNFE